MKKAELISITVEWKEKGKKYIYCFPSVLIESFTLTMKPNKPLKMKPLGKKVSFK